MVNIPEIDKFPSLIGLDSKLLTKSINLLTNIKNIKLPNTVNSESQTDLNIDELSRNLLITKEKNLRKKGKIREIKEKLEKSIADNENNIKIIDKLKAEVESLKTKNRYFERQKKLIEDEMKNLKEEYKDKFKAQENIIEELKNTKKNKLFIEKSTKQKIKLDENNKSQFLKVVNNIPVYEIVKFLDQRDTQNFFRISKNLTKYMLKSSKLMHFVMKSIIREKNQELLSYKKYEFKNDFEINETKIETICQEYLISRKLVGKDLKKILLIGLEFLQSAKIDLGIQQSKEIIQKNPDSSILGSVLSVFGGFGKKKQNKNPTERYLDDDNYFKIIDFEYQSPDEITTLLFKFLTSTTIPQDKINLFLKDVFRQFSEFLFFSNRALVEIKELELVKFLLEERFSKYKNLYFEAEHELLDLKKFVQMNREIKEIISKQKCDLELKYFNIQSEMNRLRENFDNIKVNYDESKMKSDKLEGEILNLKEIFIKENSNVKERINDITNEKNLYRGLLLEMKKYFERLKEFEVEDHL